MRAIGLGCALLVAILATQWADSPLVQNVRGIIFVATCTKSAPVGRKGKTDQGRT